MIPHQKIIKAIKSDIKTDMEHDVCITIEKLVKLIPDAPRDEIISTLVDMPGVQITDPSLGGLIIPANYFQ